jgi:hypothetical protein
MAKFQRINENVFKLAEDNLPHEEIATMWQEDEQGEYIQINDKYGTWYVAHGRAIEQIAAPNVGDWKFRLINQWFNQKGIFLNIWYVNERGNVELVSKSGKFLGGLV